jgi:hypothetical protein
MCCHPSTTDNGQLGTVVFLGERLQAFVQDTTQINLILFLQQACYSKKKKTL